MHEGAGRQEGNGGTLAEVERERECVCIVGHQAILRLGRVHIICTVTLHISPTSTLHHGFLCASRPPLPLSLLQVCAGLLHQHPAGGDPQRGHTAAHAH